MLEELENGSHSDHLNSAAEFTQRVNSSHQAEESNPESGTTAASSGAHRIPPAQLMELPRRQLRRSGTQIRAECTDLDVLSESLDAHGMLYPIFVVKREEYLDDGKELHDILDGQRRFDASEGKPGFETLRCFVLEPGIEATDFVCIQLTANANRANLSPADQARAVHGLYQKSKCKSVNEFVESDHHLPFKSVWLGHLLSVGRAEQSDIEEERSIFAEVRLGKLGIAAAAKRLGAIRDRQSLQKGKRRTGRPRVSNSKLDSKEKVKKAGDDKVFVCAKDYLIPLAGRGKSRPGSKVCGDWFAGIFRLATSKGLGFDDKEARHATERLLSLFKSE